MGSRRRDPSIPMSEIRALSLRQPWAHAVVYGGKRIENRLKWTNRKFRGEFFIHASSGMKPSEYDDAIRFAERQGLPWRPPFFTDLQREASGGIIGIGRVVDVILRSQDPRLTLSSSMFPGEEIQTQYRWWMGGFALVLADVRPLPFVPCKGMLGFFRVPQPIADQALAQAA